MTREEAENRIYELMQEIRSVVLEYNPEAEYLHLRMSDRNLTSISFNNDYWISGNEEHTLDAYFSEVEKQ